VWEVDEGLGTVPSDSCFSVSRDSEGKEATGGRAASSHSRRSTAWFGFIQREHAVF
jgi:hypothetical protein